MRVELRTLGGRCAQLLDLVQVAAGPNDLPGLRAAPHSLLALHQHLCRQVRWRSLLPAKPSQAKQGTTESFKDSCSPHVHSRPKVSQRVEMLSAFGVVRMPAKSWMLRVLRSANESTECAPPLSEAA